jgi:hypothetical protein
VLSIVVIRSSVNPVPPLQNSQEQRNDHTTPEQAETAAPGREIREIRLRFRFISNEATLLVAEILLALVGTAEARAEPNGAAQQLKSAAPRHIRQLEFRQLIVRSLQHLVPPRLQSGKYTADDVARNIDQELRPAGQFRDWRQMLMQPVIDRGAAPFAKFTKVSGDMRGSAGSLSFGLGMRPAVISAQTVKFVPIGTPAALQTSQRVDRVTPTPRPVPIPGTSAAPKPITAPEAAIGPIPVVRNTDVRPDRNLDTLKSATPAAPVGAYDPTGITVGRFLYKPAVEISAGYDNNPGHRAGGGGSAVVVVAPELAIRSQFERHQLNVDLRGAYTEDAQLQTLSHPTAEARVDGRYELSGATQIIGEGRFLNDALVTPGFVKQPRATTLGTTAGIMQKFGAAEIAVKGSFDRNLFSDGILAGNQVLMTQDRNYNQPGVQLRTSYALTPQFSPFVDVSLDRRNHDLKIDFNGMRRDSNGIAGRAGVAVNVGSLSGDVSAGYLTRRFDDPAMRNVSGWIADATLAWAATDATTFVLVARSQASETPAANISGILSRDLILQADHQFEPWLIGTLRTGYGQDQFVGITRTDNRFFVAGGGVYKLSRTVQLKGDVRAEWTRSSLPVNDFLAVVGLFGVRLQY